MSFNMPGDTPRGNALGNGRQTVAHGIDSRQVAAAVQLGNALVEGGTTPGRRPLVANQQNVAVALQNAFGDFHSPLPPPPSNDNAAVDL